MKKALRQCTHLNKQGSTTQALSATNIPASEALRIGGPSSYLLASPPYPLGGNHRLVFHPDSNTTFVRLSSPLPVTVMILPSFGVYVCVYVCVHVCRREFYWNLLSASGPKNHNSCLRVHDSADF